MLFLIFIAISLSAVVVAAAAIWSQHKEHKANRDKLREFEEEYPGSEEEDKKKVLH